MIQTKEKYSKIAEKYDKLEERLPINKFRVECISHLSGKILEVGIGSGGNIKFYNNDHDVTGIDFSKGMLNISQRKIDKNKMRNIKLIEMDIEEMQFPDNSFNSVLATGVFCTVPNPEKGLEEIYRVLTPGGKAVFLEHMKSSSKIKNFLMKGIEKILYPLIGDYMLRETEKSIRALNFKKIESKNVMLGDVVRIIVAIK